MALMLSQTGRAGEGPRLFTSR